MGLPAPVADDGSPDERRGTRRANSPFRVGLQIKCVLILAALVVGITLAGGWLHYDAVRTALQAGDCHQAAWICQALALAAQEDILDRRSEALQRLAADCLRNESVEYIALLDAEGRVLASAAQAGEPGTQAASSVWPATMHGGAWRVDSRRLNYARPVVFTRTQRRITSAPSTRNERGEVLVGAVRLTLNTSRTAQELGKTLRRASVIAAVTVLVAMPLGYLLVWRALLQPLRRLARTADKLAEGDTAVRTGVARSDEMGDVAAAFDAVIDRLAASGEQVDLRHQRLARGLQERTAEVERLQSRLREEMGEKDEFLRAISDDLGARLRGIAGLAEGALAKWRGVLPGEAVDRVEAVAIQAGLGASVLADLLDVARVKSSPESRQAVDMNELLNAVASAFAPELKARGMELAIHGPMPLLYVEPMRARQVFCNLVDNALRYMDRPRGGRIEVAYRFAEGMHEFIVSDNGPGIPPEEHRRIFHVLQRGPAAAKRHAEGRGLGLALVRAVASNYEGRAWVESEPEQGSVFHVTFSAAATEPLLEPPARDRDSLGAPTATSAGPGRPL